MSKPKDFDPQKLLGNHGCPPRVHEIANDSIYEVESGAVRIGRCRPAGLYLTDRNAEQVAVVLRYVLRKIDA